MNFNILSNKKTFFPDQLDEMMVWSVVFCDHCVVMEDVILTKVAYVMKSEIHIYSYKHCGKDRHRKESVFRSAFCLLILFFLVIPFINLNR